MWDEAIRRTFATERHLDPWEQARMFALLNVALAGRLHRRPGRKVRLPLLAPAGDRDRAANQDGNPATTADPKWTPLEITPAIPDHPSGPPSRAARRTGVFQEYFGTEHTFVRGLGAGP